MAEYKRVCNFCHKDFIAQKFTTKFCSHRCASLAYKMKVRQGQENIISNQRREKKYVVGFWLVIGKNDGSVWDRDSINKKLKSDSVFTERFFELVTSLGDNYFVEVNNEVQDNKSFESVEDFKRFILQDNRKNYFIIGKDYTPNAKEVFEENIVNTALEEFSRLYPIYELVKHRLF